MPVEEMLDRMSSRELTEWMAFAQVEPFGQEVDNWRFGMLAAVQVNLHSPKRRVKPEHFMPRVAQAKSDDDMLKVWQSFFPPETGE
jgi:hypothetical protein